MDDAMRVQMQPKQGDSTRTHRFNSLNESKLIRLGTGDQAQHGKRKQDEKGDWALQSLVSPLTSECPVTLRWT